MAVWAFRTLRVIRPDIEIQLAATLAHCVLILARLVGFIKQRPSSRHGAKFIGGGIVALSYLIALLVLMRPQLFPALKSSFGLN